MLQDEELGLMGNIGRGGTVEEAWMVRRDVARLDVCDATMRRSSGLAAS